MGGVGSGYGRVRGMVAPRSSKIARWVGVGIARVATLRIFGSWPYRGSWRVRVDRGASRAGMDGPGWGGWDRGRAKAGDL